MKTTEQRLFTPGDGATPPALTGREREEAVLTRCLGDLLSGRAPPHNVVLTGPRGTGKTVLLNWFERTCRDHVSDVDVLKLTPDDIPTRDALIEVLAPTPRLAKLLPRKLGVATVGSVEWAPPAGGMRNLRDELTARCRRKPLATLVDEAHTLDLVVGRALLNASQQVRADAPFLLVLAGTPGLAAHLGAMNASFWSRLGEGRLGIGLLSDAAARAALVEPLAAHDEGIDADALATVVDDSQCYPYFIQLWGEALWERHLTTGATQLTIAHATAARPDVTARITDYYEDRYLELDRSGWLAVAERVADRFHSTPTLTYEQLKSAVAAGLAANADPQQVHTALTALQRLGFVWRPPGQLPPVRYEPGIPSLMAYVLDHAAPTHGEALPETR
ncbi:MAG: ATP-binding protein [Spirochaetaceae bacterium]|nr:ATP-binding protein [Spirochaetaceae bacterium]